MALIVGVRIKNSGKLFYFSPEEVWPKRGDRVVVETSRGIVMGDVIIGLKKIEDEMLTIPLKPVLRIATKEDIAHQEELDAFATEAFRACKEKIIEHNLDMKLVRVEPMFDNSKIMFYFTANQRIDFRDLVKDLAAVFKTRIELRQIGVRDEAKIIGTLGVCGRKICCASWLGDFQPVSIKMAKEQSLSLNPTKISGACGRLMCCLKYEQDFYEQMHKLMPKVGKTIDTPDGSGVVTDVNVIRETLTVRIEKEDEAVVKSYTMDQVNNPEKYKAEKEQKSISEFEQFIMRSKEAAKEEAPANMPENNKQARIKADKEQTRNNPRAKGTNAPKQNNENAQTRPAKVASHAPQVPNALQAPRKKHRVKAALPAQAKNVSATQDAPKQQPKVNRHVEHIAPKTLASIRRSMNVPEGIDAPMPLPIPKENVKKHFHPNKKRRSNRSTKENE